MLGILGLHGLFQLKFSPEKKSHIDPTFQAKIHGSHLPIILGEPTCWLCVIETGGLNVETRSGFEGQPWKHWLLRSQVA